MKARPVVANTRDEAPDGPLTRALRAEGIEPWHCPTIAIAPPDNPAELADALDAIDRIDWVIFTSAHAVDATCRHQQWIHAARVGGLPRLAAIGPATARRLRELGHVPDCTPEVASAGPLAAAVSNAAGTLEGARVLWPRSDLARRDLLVALSREGATVVAPIAYRTLPVRPDRLAPLVLAIDEGRLAGITFCSPSSAEHFARGMGRRDLEPLAGRVIVGSIGPTTTAALAALKLPPDVQAPDPSTSGLASAMAVKLGVARRRRS